jgi:hypothetical protein
MFLVPVPVQQRQQVRGKRVLDKRAAQRPIFCKVVGRSSQQRPPEVQQSVPPLDASGAMQVGPGLVGRICRRIALSELKIAASGKVTATNAATKSAINLTRITRAISGRRTLVGRLGQ